MLHLYKDHADSSHIYSVLKAETVHVQYVSEADQATVPQNGLLKLKNDSEDEKN